MARDATIAAVQHGCAPFSFGCVVRIAVRLWAVQCMACYSIGDGASTEIGAIKKWNRKRPKIKNVSKRGAKR